MSRILTRRSWWPLGDGGWRCRQPSWPVRIVDEDGWLERDMRQSSPFAGVLTEQERYRVLAEFRRDEEAFRA